MVDHSRMKLGRRPPKHILGLPLISRYTVDLPPAPPAIDWTNGIASFGEMLNDKFGDCTCAAAGHQIQIWTLNASSEFTPSDADIEYAYEKACGFDPANPDATDNGGVETDVLSWWAQNAIGGHKLAAFVGVQPSNHESVRDAVSILGGCYIGVNLPISCQTQDVWDVPPGGAAGDGAPGSWGGHAVVVAAYDARGLTCITWGEPKKMTWAFWDAYVEEAYGLLSTDWIAANGNAPNALPWATVQTDFEALRT